MVVVAAHLDDAVLSVGEAIATHPEVTVITVFCGRPAHGTALTDYDRSCGFADSADAMVTRRAEHEVAMRLLGAGAIELTLLDHQYRDRPLDDGERALLFHKLVGAIKVVDPAIVLVPMGLTHPDHLELGAVCRHVIASMAPDAVVEVGVYEDLPYRVLDPEEAVDRLTDLEVTLGALPVPWPLSSTGALATKLEAIACYQSQLSEDIGRCARVPERIWRYR